MNRRRTAKRKTGGYQLFEVLVVIMLIGFLMSFGLKLFVSASQFNAYSALQLGRAAALDELQRALRDNLREAQGPVAQVGEHQAGPELLIVALSPDDAAARYALWGRFDGDDRLVRYVLRDEGDRMTAESYRRFAYPVDDFTYSLAESGRGVSVSFTLRHDDGERVYDTPRHTVQVAFRGALP